jgi:hypothetical protein
MVTSDSEYSGVPQREQRSLIRTLCRQATCSALAIAIAGGFFSAAAEDGKVVTDPRRPFLENAKKSSLPRLSLTAQIIKNVDVDGVERYQNKFLSDPMTRLSTDNVFERYQLQLKSNDVDDRFYKTSGYLLNTLVTVTAGRLGGGGTMLGVGKGLATKASSTAIDDAVKEIAQHGHQETKDWLETELREKAQLGVIGNLASVGKLTPEQKRQWLRDNEFVGDVLKHASEVRDEDKPIVEGMLISALDAHIKAGLDLSAKVDATQDAKLAAQAKQIGAVSRSLNEFRQETEEELQDIQTKQQEISDKVGKLEGRVDKNTDDIAFLQKFMFDKMDPAEQLAALKSGMLSLSEEDREKKTLQIEILQKRQELTASVAKFGQGAASLANIARNLKVDPNVVKTLDDAAKVANVAQTVMVGIASGGLGYLSAAEAVTGFAFGGGDDGGAARHAEIMAALGEIKQGIAEIQQMLVQIGAQLDQIQKNQQTMMEALYQVSQQIDKNHREEMEEITKLRTDMITTATMLNETLFKDILSCDVLNSRLKNRKFSWTTPIPFEALQSEYAQRGDKCLEGLKDNLSNPFDLGTYHLKRFKGYPGSTVEEYVDKTYPESLKVALRVADAASIRDIVESLQRPVETLSALEIKLKALRQNQDEAKTRLSDRPEQQITMLLENPVSAQTLIKHTGYLVAMHPFFELQSVLRSGNQDDLISLKGQSDEGYQLLRTVKDYYDLAISQQVMMSGDLLLPIYVKIWLDGLSAKGDAETDDAFAKRKSLEADLETALGSNDILAANFVLKLISDQIDKNGNIISYAFAYQVPTDPTYMQKILPTDQFTIQPPQAGKPVEWTVKIGEKLVKLPSPTDVTQGKLMQSPELYQLLTARSEVQEQMDTYPEFSNLSKGDWELVHQAVWFTAKDGAK